MLLQINDLQKNYGDFHLNCSMQVKKGGITGIIGANGAGKTTIFKAVLNLIKTDGGNIQIFGKNVKEIKKNDKMRIATVMTEAGFCSILKVKDIISIMKAMSPKFDEKFFLEKCRHYEIPMEQPMKEFSTGMKAKLKVLIAMSYDAELLILDEPTVGLDYMTRNEILDELRDYMERDGKGILISSHISTDLEGICDDLYFLQNGEIKLHEETDRILSEYGVLKLTGEQYEQIDKKYLLYVIKNAYSVEVLTNTKGYYCDKYPEYVIENGNIDQVIKFLTKGETV